MKVLIRLTAGVGRLVCTFVFSQTPKTITIHHERPCRIEISHPRGRKFNQGRGLPSPWLNSDPKGEISLSYMDRLMMDRFSLTFRRVFVRT